MNWYWIAIGLVLILTGSDLFVSNVKRLRKTRKNDKESFFREMVTIFTSGTWADLSLLVAFLGLAFLILGVKG